MKIFIVHHHLRKGGVASVLKNQVVALNAMDGFVPEILCGYAPDGEYGCPVRIIPELEYLPFDTEATECIKIAETLYAKFERLSESNTCMFHFHNLNLGKNPVLTYIVSLLAKRGIRILNHAHDFAEDRPRNMAFSKQILEEVFNCRVRDIFYPQCSNYHFATINRSDEARIHAYQKDATVHYLPNAVPGFDSADCSGWMREKTRDILGIAEDAFFYVYPVRAIARKNIGELLLLSALFPDYWFAVTLPPENPIELELYSHWKNVAKKLSLPILFEIGQNLPFTNILHAADACITTSRMEGFGLSFLEPWLLGIPVIGRNLPMVTSDFESEGITFPALYDSLSIPGYSGDFAYLSADEQSSIVEAVAGGEISKEMLLSANEPLRFLFSHDANMYIKTNKQIIEKEYSLTGYGKRLWSIYQQLSGTS